MKSRALRSTWAASLVLGFCAGCGTGSGGVAPLDANGTADGAAALDTFAPTSQVPAKLARWLWNDLAASQEVADLLRQKGSPSKVSDVVNVMLADPRARSGVAGFVRWWLLLDDLATLPKPDGVLTPELRASLAREAPAFVNHVIFDADSRYETLMTAPFTFMDANLATLYGVDGVATDAMIKVSFPGKDRLGLLGEAGVLTRAASVVNPSWPARRGGLVLRTLGCATVRFPRPRAALIQQMSGISIRTQMIEFTKEQSCLVCHRYVNPLGFAFLKFDTFGRLLSDDNGQPFDTSADLPANTIFPGESSMHFDDEPDLVRKLSTRADVRRCLVKKWMMYAAGSELAPDDDALNSVSAAFEVSGGNLKSLQGAIADSNFFLQANLAVDVAP